MPATLSNSGQTKRTVVPGDLLGISLVWLISIFIVNPLGNFPLNDDWSFGTTVRRLVETWSFRPLGWADMPLLTNTLWGSLFCLPFGFSFTALRISTLTASLIGVLSLSILCRELGQPRGLAATIALTAAFNPISYALSNTFMTDVPFTTLTILAALFFARYLRNGSNVNVILGTAFSLAATLSRQLGLAAPLAFAVCAAFTRRSVKSKMLLAAIPTALCAGALLVFQIVLQTSDRLPANYNLRARHLLNVLSQPGSFPLVPTLATAAVVLFYLGLFLLPVLLSLLSRSVGSRREQTKMVLASGIVMILCGGALYLTGAPLMPLMDNILVKSGIGPLTLRDVYLLNLNHVPPLPDSFWLAVTAIGCIGTAGLLALTGRGIVNGISAIRQSGTPSEKHLVSAFLLLVSVIYLAPLCMVGFYDRYVIPAIPLCAAGIAGLHDRLYRSSSKNAGPLHVAAMLLLSLFIIFSTAVTRDYLAWNRVRWEASLDLMNERHVDAAKIDGGFEFNGLYFYKPGPTNSNKSWWWVQDDTYQIAFGDVKGYHVIKEYRYTNWMPPRSAKIEVLQRNASP